MNRRILFDKNYFIWILILFSSLFIASIFYLTGDIQEDALITFRTAKNFAIYNKFSYNLDDSLPGSTSIIYGLICGYIFKISGFVSNQFFFLSVTLFNSFSLIIALLGFIFVFKFFKNISMLSIAFLPSFITLMHKGMETGILAASMLLAIASIQYSINTKNYKFSYYNLIFIVLSAIRIDSIAISLLIIFPLFINNIFTKDEYNSIYKNFSKALKYASYPLIFSIIGFSLNIYLNFKFFGTTIPHTALAKRLVYENNFTLTNFLSQFKSLYFFGANENSFLLPAPTKYLMPIYPFILPITLFIIILGFRLRKKAIYKFSNFKNLQLNLYTFQAFVSIGLFYPIIFCLSGLKIFPWYLWISTFSIQIVYIMFFDSLIVVKNRYIFKILFINILLLFFLTKLFLSLNDGLQENLHRAAVGKYISTISSPKSSLILEPAGYIPFYAGVKTIDEVGLISREFTNFIARKSKGQSIVAFWKDNIPEFLVQRKHILNFKDSLGNSFTESEILWFKKNYCLHKTFIYDDQVLAANNKFKQFFLSLGSHTDYYLYRKTSDGDTC